MLLSTWRSALMLLGGSFMCAATTAPGTCLHGWPLFESAVQLAADPWGAYLRDIYGDLPEDQELYPWCMGDMWAYYNVVLEKNKVTNIPNVSGTCPSHNATIVGERYLRNNAFTPPGLSWSWHPSDRDDPRAPQKPLPNHTFVEVLHHAYPRDEKVGAWFFHGKGTGIWLNLGVTVAFVSHEDGFKFFNASMHNPECRSKTGFNATGNITSTNECMATLAAARGYDSIQFLKGWPNDCAITKNKTILATMNYEIVSTRLQGMYNCASPDGQSEWIRSGWKGDRACTCNNTWSTYLNCAEVPLP